jgi:thioesterase domain-containing protein
MGIRLIELRRGYAAARAPMDGNSNHLGTMYAGTLFAVAEVLGGAIVAASFDVAKVYPVVKSLKIDYRRPARDAVTAKASISEAQIAELTAAAQTAGKAQCKLTAQIFDTSGQLVAETEGDYQIRAHGT